MADVRALSNYNDIKTVFVVDKFVFFKNQIDKRVSNLQYAETSEKNKSVKPITRNQNPARIRTNKLV